MNKSADVVYENATIFTSDAAGSWSDSVAIRGGVIAAVGGRAVAAVTDASTQVIDCAGALMLPGFQDAHIHAPFAGLNRLHVDLEGLTSREAYLSYIKDYVGRNPSLDWVIGGGWALEHFPNGIASKDLLDEICPDRPVFLFSRDVHQAWVNSEALRRAGITSSTPDPANGRIERDPVSGEVVGTLQEAAAYDFNRDHVPTPSQQIWESAIGEAQHYLWSLGITGWQDAWLTPATAAAYDAMARDGRLKAKVLGAQWWEWDKGLEQIDYFETQRRLYTHERFSAGTVKIMIDGVLENYTGALLEPYCDGCGTPAAHSGMMHVDSDVLGSALARLDSLDFQVHMHAIGDKAVRAGLDAVEHARKVNGPRANRHHIAHVQIVHPDDIDRFRKLDVAVNCQTFWAKADAQVLDLTGPLIGAERMRWMYPFGDLARSGATLAMGSDWGVTTADPLEQIAVATTRTDPHVPGSKPFLPDQVLSLTTAIRAFTAGSAYVNHDSGGGSIEPGKRGDFVLLDRNVFDGSQGSPADAHVTHTIISGEQVYQR